MKKLLALLIIIGGLFGVIVGGEYSNVYADSGSGSSGSSNSSKGCDSANYFVTKVVKIGLEVLLSLAV